MAELIDKWEVVNKLIQLENKYQFYKEQWDADVLYRRICELEIGIGKMPGVTVQEQDGCEYCKEDSEGYRKMIGAFSITNPFHGSVWNIETCHCKPRQIHFCPMCGRRLPQPPKGE